MTIGFTGTRAGMTSAQRQTVLNALAIAQPGPVSLFLHGACRGADTEAHDLARGLGYRIRLYPAIDVHQIDEPWRQLRGINDCELVDPHPPLDRNRLIVDACDVLIATPRRRKEELRSGTWATIRYAREVGRPTLMVWP